MAEGEGRGRTALVTGASAGIGAAFARFLAGRGHDLILTARRRDRLEALASELASRHGTKSLVLTADLAEPEAVPALLSEIAAHGASVDVLVANAGYGLPGTFVERSWSEHAAFVEVMVRAPLALAHAVLPGMIARSYGRIVAVASLAGLLPGTASFTLYGASKAFLVKACQSLAVETEGTGVRICALCPGFTHTEFHAAAGVEGEMKGLPSFLWQSAEEVVAEGWAAVEAGRPVCVTGAHNRAIAAVGRLLPPSVAFALASRRARGRSKK